MAGPPRASVCIPTCDGEQFVAEAIESVLAQTFDDFELLVIDDRSGDRTLDIVGSYRDPRLHVHQNDARLGIAGNWNRCLELARGEFFCLFHQDDVMLPENLAQKIQLLEADPSVGFVHSSVEFLTEPGAPPGSGVWIEHAPESFVVDGRAYFRKMILSGNRVCAPAVVARREVLAGLGGFNEGLGYALDYELWLKTCVNRRVGFLSQPLVRYRWHQRNASHAYRFERGSDEAVSAATSAIAFYGEHGGHPQELELLADAVAILDHQRRWASDLEKAKIWLSEQCTNWKGLAERREGTILELRSWINELQKAKTSSSEHAQELEKAKIWLSEQYTRWKSLAEQREATILELRSWIDELEKAKIWLSEQYTNWKNLAEQREGTILELRGWIAELEKAKTWSTEQAEHWRNLAEQDKSDHGKATGSN